MPTIKEIRRDIDKRNADQAIRLFVPFAQSVLKQGLPDISTGSFQKVLSGVAGLPPGYLEEREVYGGKVKLSEITYKEHQEGIGFVSFPVKIMEYKDPNGHEVDVWVTLRPGFFDAKIFSREGNHQFGNVRYQKPKGFMLKWVAVQ